MAVKTKNFATQQQAASGPATLHSMYFVGGTATGEVALHNGTATTAARLVRVPTPAIARGNTLAFGGGGLKFSGGIHARPVQSGGVTIVYATGT